MQLCPIFRILGEAIAIDTPNFSGPIYGLKLQRIEQCATLGAELRVLGADDRTIVLAAD